MGDNLKAVLYTKPLYTLAKHYAELYYQEYVANFIGRRNGRRIELVTAELIRTMEGDGNSASYTNEAARKRIERLNDAITANRRTRVYHDLRSPRSRRRKPVEDERQRTYYKIGQTHTHPKGETALSKGKDGDIEGIRDHMERERLDHWVELVIAINERNYKSRKKVEERFIRHARKIRHIIHDDPHHGYDATFAAYWFEWENDDLVFEEIPISVPSWERMGMR